MTCALFLVPIGVLDLVDRREEHIAADAVDTLRNGRWLVAYDHGRPRLKKPPLSRWLAAISLSVFPKSEFAVRLPFAMAALATAWIVGRWAAELGGADAGLAAGACFATNFLVISECWVASAEALLMAGVAASLYAFSVAVEQSTSASQRRRLLVASGAALGLAALSKGPIAFLLFALAASGFAVTSNRRDAIRCAFRPEFLVVAISPIAVWAVAVYLRYPEAVAVWRHEMLHKVSGPDRRSMLLPKFLPMAAPWVPLAIAGVCLPAQSTNRFGARSIWPVWAWCALNLAMFSLWSGAREPYYLACMPAVAILSGAAWSSAFGVDGSPLLRWAAWLQLGVVAIVVAILPVAAYREARPQLGVAIVVSIVGLLAMALSWRRLSADRRLLVPACMIAAALLGSLPEVQRRCRALSHAEFCMLAEQEATIKGKPIHYLQDRLQFETDYMDAPDVTESIWFYLSNPPALIGDIDDAFAATNKTTLLLVVSPRQSEALKHDGRFAVAALVDEASFARWDTRLIELARRVK